MSKKLKKKRPSRLEDNLNKNNVKSKNVKNKSKKEESNKKKKKKFSFFSFIFTIILILIIIFCGKFGYYLIKEDFNVKKAFSSLLNNSFFNPKPITVLVLGVSTDINTELSDTIMICSYNPSTHKSFILSIPRDTFVGANKNSAKGSDKINSMYSRKGVNAMIEKIEGITNLDIDYYAVVKNNALIDIVDAVGGVNFNVPINMNYDDPSQDLHIHLQAGEQLIDGAKAEQLLRFRHNNDGSSYPSSYGDNDFGRMKTQRDFMVQTAKQTLTIGNIFRLPKISSAVFSNLETDLSFGTMIKYIPSALSFDMDSMQTYQLPGESKKLNSLWFYIHDESETIKLTNELKENLSK